MNLKLIRIGMCISFVSVQMAVAQDKSKVDTKKIEVFGQVQNNIWFNTRVNTALRDGTVNLYPTDATNLNTPADVATKGLHTTADDKNNEGNIGYSAIYTRVGVKFSGLSAFGAKLNGVVEGDFSGLNGAAGNGTEQLLRLRHAYVNLNWDDKSQLLIGQYWNPNFIPTCFPTLAGGGLAYNPSSFIPQVRYTRKLTKDFSLIGLTFMNSVLNFSTSGGASPGPNIDLTTANTLNGVAMGQYSKIPSFALQASYDNGKVMATIGAEINALRPRTWDTYNATTGMATGLATDVVKTTKETLITHNFIATAKITFSESWMLKLNTTYGQNYTQYVGVGGTAEYRDKTTGNYKYSAVNISNSWAEIIFSKSKTFQPALFFGYDKNLGTDKNLSDTDVNLSTVAFTGKAINKTRTFDHIIRVSPRVDILSGNLKLQFGYDYSRMVYGDTDPNFKILGTGEARKFTAINHRISATVLYSF